MKQYLIIETRDPIECRDVDAMASLAADLARSGASASVLLTDNGVFAARIGAATDALDVLSSAGVGVFADNFSLSERGIESASLAPGVRPATVDLVIDRLLEGASVMWR